MAPYIRYMPNPLEDNPGREKKRTQSSILTLGNVQASWEPKLTDTEWRIYASEN